ncbi:hypothetical protein, partial [Streptomyces fildesensis]|uniref:hypothetical protein n=1 Tax=Streptomyces fildesensis TaxID=375757 RepID=UPI001E4EDAAD
YKRRVSFHFYSEENLSFLWVFCLLTMASAKFNLLFAVLFAVLLIASQAWARELTETALPLKSGQYEDVQAKLNPNHGPHDFHHGKGHDGHFRPKEQGQAAVQTQDEEAETFD